MQYNFLYPSTKGSLSQFLMTLLFYSKGDIDAKTSITGKRKLSADLTLKRAQLGLKNREGMICKGLQELVTNYSTVLLL